MENTLLNQILAECQLLHASDIHIKEGDLILYRVNGVLIESDKFQKIERQAIESLLNSLLLEDKDAILRFLHNLEIDFGYIHPDGVSYRGNGYITMGKIALALRRFPEKVPNLVELGIPKSLAKILQAKQGFFLVTGPTGSGKSTTMASMLEAINDFREDRILTIEDPIEYLFKNRKSYFTQREIGRDTHSFAQAIRAAMREDANIIMIGEIRDAETMETALNLAETGHLVFSTLHTSGSVQTITRMIQFFPQGMETQIRTRLAGSLLGVISQRLIKMKDKSERVAIREVMLASTGIKNLIASGELTQLSGMIEMGTDEGMITMRKSAEILRDQGLIEEKEYRGYFANESYKS